MQWVMDNAKSSFVKSKTFRILYDGLKLRKRVPQHCLIRQDKTMKKKVKSLLKVKSYFSGQKF